MDTFDRTWQGTEPLLFITWNLTQLYAQKVCFCQLVVFALVNNNLCGHVRIEIPSHPLFPLWIAHPNSIKTRNPTPACNCKSRFQPVFSSNTKYHGPKKVKSHVLPNLLGTLFYCWWCAKRKWQLLWIKLRISPVQHCSIFLLPIIYSISFNRIQWVWCLTGSIMTQWKCQYASLPLQLMSHINVN